ncbi:DUF4097 family beta strand repeat-containing protein [Mesotoga sp. BH458_6_3_2_1]|uniref:DUF4097 family beta strand repeat-containing protein n=1 Tax=Mesotoga sp. BH458_6_3_2_1 TaxID=1437446 RepID=UPI000EF24F48|nr:DUF4097 family beta strand repeat-containing protein [Mesotoga sp. BH458_6_3_2_1]RLL81713.1 hypothetical protein Y697_13385 [Mesotoga sp. BH458_6_3_2_1]
MRKTNRRRGLALAGLLLGIGVLLIGAAVIIRPEILGFSFSSGWSFNGVKFNEDFSETVTEKINSLEIDSQNGKVEVVGWNRDYVEIKVERSIRVADENLKEEYLEKTRPVINAMDGKLTVIVPKLSQTNEFRGQATTIYLSVPSETVEDITVNTSNGAMVFRSLNASIRGRSSNGGLELISVSGSITLETSNSPIFVEECAGVMELKSTNGAFEASGISGTFIIETSNAPITIKKGTINISANSTNGAITVTESTLFGSGNYLKTSNARILCDALLPETGVFEIMTTNGQVNLLVDDSLKAEFDASTTNGSVNLKDLMVAVISSTSTSMKGNLNGGNGLLITLKTSNSNISIQNRKKENSI